MRVLISAFACEPGRGSEQEVGWRWATELSRHLPVTVLTQTRNRPGIERRLAQGGMEECDLTFDYLQLAGPLYRLKSRFDFLTWPYYAIWQRLAAARAAEMHRESPFDLIHHLTFASFRVPIWMKQVGLPVVMGPVGGAEQASWKLLSYRVSPAAWLKEAVRNVMTYPSAALLSLFPPIKRGRGICLAATPGMLEIFHRRGLPARLFPTVGSEEGVVHFREPFSDGGCRFLYVGRLHVLKGIQFLLEAFAHASLPGATLTIVGGGPEEARLKRQAADLKLGDRVTWMGPLTRAELSPVYSGHDVLVAPSLYESGGMVVLEAMHHGLPCIVLDVGGHAVSVDSSCGFKVSARGTAVDAIAGVREAMERYNREPELRWQHGREAAKRVAREYGWKSKVERMLEIYEDVLRSGGAAGTMRP